LPIAVNADQDQVPWGQAEPRLRAGALIDLDPSRSIEVPLFWQQWKLDSPALMAAADAIAAAAVEINLTDKNMRGSSTY
jgi:LysR family transcriptional regulator, chromosome initiation inhibitor